MTPPFGATLFYMKGTVPPSVTMTDIYRGMYPQDRDAQHLIRLLLKYLSPIRRAGHRARRASKLSRPTPSNLPGAKLSASSAGWTDGVTAARANLVRAAFKAGVKPLAIARQFGLTQATVRELLKSLKPGT